MPPQVFCVWLTPNQDLAYVLATGYVAASILLSGFYLRVGDMRLSVMRALSWLSYTKCALAPLLAPLHTHTCALLPSQLHARWSSHAHASGTCTSMLPACCLRSSSRVDACKAVGTCHCSGPDVGDRVKV